MDESNGTCGLRLQSIGVENDEPNRQRWRETLLGTKGLGDFCGGAILFTETLYQDTTDGKKMTDLAKDDNKVSAQSKLFQRASANSKAQKGEYDPATANEDA